MRGRPGGGDVRVPDGLGCLAFSWAQDETWTRSFHAPARPAFAKWFAAAQRLLIMQSRVATRAHHPQDLSRSQHHSSLGLLACQSRRFQTGCCCCCCCLLPAAAYRAHTARRRRAMDEVVILPHAAPGAAVCSYCCPPKPRHTSNVHHQLERRAADTVSEANGTVRFQRRGGGGGR